MTTPNSTIVYRAAIEGIGDTAGRHLTATVENSDTCPPIAAIDGGDDLWLDAAGLRHLAAVCIEAADKLDDARGVHARH